MFEKVNGSRSVNEAWDAWSTAVTSTMNKHAPQKTHKLKARSNPWITREIISLMYKRDYLHRKMKRSNDDSARREYKKVRNQVVKEIRLAKKSHYKRELAASAGPKQTRESDS